jgi:SAM-dependent methyltransferase
MSDAKEISKRDGFTAEEIVDAFYRGMLKRMPDTTGFDTHVADLKQRGILPLVQGFLRSPEFHRVQSGSSPELRSELPPGMNLNFSPRNEVQTRLSRDDQIKLWKHIEEVWTRFGEEEPYWSVLTDKKFLSDQIHEENRIESFYESGAHDLKYFDAFLQRNDVELPEDATIAEFGCGLGRSTRFLARRYKRVVAFDISPSHLAAARERLRKENIDNVEFVLLDGTEGLSRLRGADIFFSLIVLQHNPPPIICEVLEHAFDGLTTGGIAFFQTPTYGSNYKFVLRDYFEGLYNQNEMEIHFVPQREIFSLFDRCNMLPLEARQDHCIGNYDQWISNTFLAQKK